MSEPETILRQQAELLELRQKVAALEAQSVHQENETKYRLEELECLVAERTAKLQAAMGELEDFSHTITHDMRAPLRAMRGYGELLLEESLRVSPKVREFVERISIAAERMDKLIVDALDYNKLVRQEVVLGPIDPQALLSGMITSYPAFQAPQARIFIQGPLPIILGNEAALTQCFSNLLTNAVKFVEKGTTPQIRIWAEDRGSHGPGETNWVRFWVEDNGIGIPADSLDKVFVMFHRLSTLREGTGIGLTLVKKAAERMHGTVGVESTVGKGSRFWMEFEKV